MKLFAFLLLLAFQVAIPPSSEGGLIEAIQHWLRPLSDDDIPPSSEGGLIEAATSTDVNPTTTVIPPSSEGGLIEAMQSRISSSVMLAIPPSSEGGLIEAPRRAVVGFACDHPFRLHPKAASLKRSS